VTGEATAAVIVGQFATDFQSVNDRIAVVEGLTEVALARHELAEVIASLPGMGPVLAAEFLAHAGTLDGYRSPAHPRCARWPRTGRPGLRRNATNGIFMELQKRDWTRPAVSVSSAATPTATGSASPTGAPTGSSSPPAP
jgi:hypothetical protein